jgi:hypothetical protein
VERAQRIAYYPAAAMPPADAKGPVPVDRKAALEVRLGTAAELRARSSFRGRGPPAPPRG